MNPDMKSIVALMNTRYGSNGSLGIPAAIVNLNSRSAANAFSCNARTVYETYGTCNSSSTSQPPTCGLDSGFHVTVRPYPTLLTAFRMTASGSSIYDVPDLISIEGSNAEPDQLLLGSSWTLINIISPGVTKGSGAENRVGTMQQLRDSSDWYRSYRILAVRRSPGPRGLQYTGFEFYGYYY